MAIGRTEDRNTPGNPLGHKPRRDVRGPIRVTHLGPRSTRPHTKAGHIYGRPRHCNGDLHGSATRLLAVIYPVSNDPDGFRGTTANH